MERSGSKVGMSEVDNEVVSLQTRLGTFKQGCRIVLHSDAGSVVSKQKSISRASSRASLSSSSRAKLAKAALENRKAQERFLKEADALEAEKTVKDAKLLAEQAKEDAERQKKMQNAKPNKQRKMQSARRRMLNVKRHKSS